MADETLSTELKWATPETNVADEPTPIIVWDVPDATEVTLVEGMEAILDAEKQSGGGNPSRSTRLGFAYREPNDPLNAWTVISDFGIAPFNTLSLKDQQSGDNAERRRVKFDPDRVAGGMLTLEDADELALVALSSDVIDPSTLFFNYPVSIRNV